MQAARRSTPLVECACALSVLRQKSGNMRAAALRQLAALLPALLTVPGAAADQQLTALFPASTHFEFEASSGDQPELQDPGGKLCWHCVP